MCHMAGTMKFSEVPPYPYTCRSLHRVRTGKMRDKPDLCSRSFRSRRNHSQMQHGLFCGAAKFANLAIDQVVDREIQTVYPLRLTSTIEKRVFLLLASCEEDVAGPHSGYTFRRPDI